MQQAHYFRHMFFAGKNTGFPEVGHHQMSTLKYATERSETAGACASARCATKRVGHNWPHHPPCIRVGCRANVSVSLRFVYCGQKRPAKSNRRLWKRWAFSDRRSCFSEFSLVTSPTLISVNRPIDTSLEKRRRRCLPSTVDTVYFYNVTILHRFLFY